MDNRVTDRDVIERFDEVIDRVNRSGATLTIERDGRPIAQITPPAPVAAGATLREFFDRNPPPDEDFIRDVKEAIAAQTVEIPKSPWD